MSTTPAGWYPQEDGRQRYWDGTQWTEHFAPGDAASPTAGPVGSAGWLPATSAATVARPWFKKKRFIIPGALVAVFFFFGAINAAGDDTDLASTDTTSSTSAAATGDSRRCGGQVRYCRADPVREARRAEARGAEADGRAGEREGERRGYLDLSGFSKKGLTKQLAFEGYKAKDIDAALATMKVDWNAEAAETAQAYVDMTNFSRSGLIKQLKFEGYTSKQATHGADSAGL